MSSTMYNKNTNLANTNSNSNNSNNNNSNNNNNNTATSGPTSDRIEWSRATILDFIEDYRRQRVLWDPNTKGYHIKQTKYEALKSLGHKYGAEIRSIRSKIKSLRSSFHREHGKVLNGKRKGLNYQPMWFAYDAIRFILDGEGGDSDDADPHKNDTNKETSVSEPNNNSNCSNNNKTNSDHNNIDEELMEERKISSRDIEHFNNHFLALGLQARHPMAVIAAVEAAAAASVAHERRQEQLHALKQQQQQTESAGHLKQIELSTNTATNTATHSNNNKNAINLTSTSAAFNPISKSFNSPNPLLSLASSTSALTTTTTTAAAATTTATTTTTSVTATAINTTPPPTSTQLPPPSATTTCSLESLNVLHGSRSLDENSALAAATAIPSLPITAVARTSDFDGSEYCNISADDVKTEIFESDSTELAMLESTRTSTPVPLNYHKNATDVTINRNNISMSRGNCTGTGKGTATGTTTSTSTNTSTIAINGNSSNGGYRKRKSQTHSNVNHNEDAPSPSKSHQKHQQHQHQNQHSNAIHSRQYDYLNNSSNTNHGDVDNDDDDDDDGAGYTTSFSHLQTTLINPGNNSFVNNPSSCNHSGTAVSNANNNNPIDEYGVFGEYVAITIRKLKTSKAKIVVKHLINNLLYEAEMGKYDHGISSCKEPPELYKT